MELLSFLYQQFGGYICIWQIYNSPSARELIKSDRRDTNRNKYMENKTKCDRCVSLSNTIIIPCKIWGDGGGGGGGGGGGVVQKRLWALKLKTS